MWTQQKPSARWNVDEPRSAFLLKLFVPCAWIVYIEKEHKVAKSSHHLFFCSPNPLFRLVKTYQERNKHVIQEYGLPSL